MTLKRSIIRLSAMLAVFALAVSPVNLAQAKSVAWQRYDVDITIEPNGDLKVVETQVIEFQGGPFRGGFASIPLENTDGITDVAVSEPGRVYENAFSGAYTYTTSEDAGNLLVDWSFESLANETRTFILSYTIHGAVRQYDSGDKIRFMVISPELDFPIQSSTVTVHLPPGGPVIDDPDSIGTPMQWQTSLDNRTVTYTTTRAVNAYEGVGIQVIFEHGAVTGPKPSWQAEFDKKQDFEQNVKPWIDLGLWAIALALLLALPGALYLLWYLFGRDPVPGLTPDYIAQPPSDLPPGLVGVLTDEKADLRDLTATLIDLARRGFIALEESESPAAFGTVSKTFTLSQVGTPSGLRAYEQALYDAVFGAGETVALNKLPFGFYSRLRSIESALYTEAVNVGLFRSQPEEVRQRYRTAGALVVAGTLVLGCLAVGAGAEITGSIICPFAPMVLFGVGLIAIGGIMPARTRKGADETAKWRAFQKYLGNIQKYGDVANAADQFESYLPYAIAFGLERRWVTAFAQAPVAASVPIPRWYRPWRRPLTTAQPVVPGAGPAMQAPDLNQMGAGMVGGLNSIGDGLVNALNTAGRSFSTPPTPAGGGGSYTRLGGGSRGFSGGRSTFRGGGGFRGGGFSGGGRRGFR
ncbi:MAG: DUF2207 domain-containing protein [Chloroflexi bacterium]|nr:DUF2207 domain-containing protein [Chloroflexota bacterium]